MRIGVITGSGTHALPSLQDPEPRTVETHHGSIDVTLGTVGGAEVVHISRHGAGHVRLSNHVNFRGNALALRELGVGAVIGLTACGAVDPSVPLGSLVVFDDLHFPVNRLPSGEICTLYGEAGDRLRGHWIYESPFSEPVRRALLDAAADAGVTARDGGTYGHVDGPRFNTRSEIAQLAAAGATVVSQTGGPETTLLGEAELPFALAGYATDYANGVQDEATPVSELVRLMGLSTGCYDAVVARAVPALAATGSIAPVGTVYRFHE